MNKKTGSVITFALTLAVIWLAGSAYSRAASLVWYASSGQVEGYRVYYGTAPGDRSQVIDVGNTTRYNLDTLPLIENRTYYLCVSAYNAAGESNPCPPVVFTPGDNTPPSPPVGLTTN